MSKTSIYILPVSIMRGGTSKGIYILKRDMPIDEKKWDTLLLRLMGSPDKKQIDGLGGGQSVTSKVAIISPSRRPDADIDYTFAQVSVDKPIVSYKGNCGNILSGVAPFAIEKGLVPVQSDLTSVRIYNTNTDKVIVSEVMTPDGHVKYTGDFAIAGVPNTSAPVKLKFLNPAGTLGHGLLPTGNVIDTLHVPDLGMINVSIVDAANPLVFVKASDLGLRGTELPKDIDSDPKTLSMLEKVRGVAAIKLKLCSDYTRSAWETPSIPKLTFISPPTKYVTSSGNTVESSQIDILSRMMSMQKLHPSYAMTGAMCTAAAAVIPGSLVNQVISSENLHHIRIGHPSGIQECGVEFNETSDALDITSTYGLRTANLLLDGTAYIRLK